VSRESGVASRIRVTEEKATLPSAAGPSDGAETLAVGCSFCLAMLNDASKADRADHEGIGCG